MDICAKKCVFLLGRNFLTLGHPGVRVSNVRGKFGPKSLCLCCFSFEKQLLLGKVQTGALKWGLSRPLAATCAQSSAIGLFYGLLLEGSKGHTQKGHREKHPENTLRYPDLFSRRFREGISFPKFVQRSILKLPLSKLCAVPLALQNRAVFEARTGRKRCWDRGRKRGDQQRGQKGKKDA